MKKKSKRTLTPKLRFPEFRRGREWKHTCLAEAFETITNGKANSQDHQDDGEYPLFDRSEVVKRSPTFLFDAEAVILPGEGMSFQPRYFKGRFNLHQRAYALMDPKVIPFFAFYALDRFKSALADSAVHSTVRSLRMPIIEKFAIPCPETEAEQQKIADCLSSLDGLIAAEGRKLAALRDHKRGLMQQLFPQPGQTQPQLRFPEFRGEGEWEEVRLSRLGHLISGLTYSPDDVQDEGLLVLRSSNVQNGGISLDDCVHVNPMVQGANLSQTNDILICVRNGSKSLIGKNALIPEGLPICTHGAFMTVLRSESARFVFVLLQTEAYFKQVQADLGATINSINGKQLMRYKFRVPKPDEQHRIADCLTALDDQITAQAAKIESLNQHKRGLMQQLFPAPEVS